MESIVATKPTLPLATAEGAATDSTTLQEKWKGVSRWRAATVHFGISVGLAVAVFIGMVMIWYPAPYFEASGGKTLLLLLIGVDVVRAKVALWRNTVFGEITPPWQTIFAPGLVARGLERGR